MNQKCFARRVNVHTFCTWSELDWVQNTLDLVSDGYCTCSLKIEVYFGRHKSEQKEMSDQASEKEKGAAWLMLASCVGATSDA